MRIVCATMRLVEINWPPHFGLWLAPRSRRSVGFLILSLIPPTPCQRSLLSRHSFNVLMSLQLHYGQIPHVIVMAKQA
jgi:hypothetical protein